MLIGREHETARLRTALESAAVGTGGLVLLTGDAGVGKTRLVEEALGPRLLRGAATPAGSPYGPVIGALREYLRSSPGSLDGCGPLRNHLATQQAIPRCGLQVWTEVGHVPFVEVADDFAAVVTRFLGGLG